MLDAPRRLDSRRSDRRRIRHSGQSADAVLAELPVLVVLERLPVPVLAVGEDGTILFANTAFASMIGVEQHHVLAVTIDRIFHSFAVEQSILSAVRAQAETIVELAHADGSIVRAKMSRSALRREHDRSALVTFQDLTEQLWESGTLTPRGNQPRPEGCAKPPPLAEPAGAEFQGRSETRHRITD